MILDALKKVNSSLNSTTKDLLNEDLKSILNIHHFGLDEALSIANNGHKLSNPITYLKFKIIDAVKDLDLSKKVISSFFKSQLSKIDEAISNPLDRKALLMGNIFKPQNAETYFKAEDFLDVVAIHEEGLKEGTESVIASMRYAKSLGVKTKILNPFNDIVFDLEMQTEREHSQHANRVFTMDKNYHDINSLYVVQLVTNNTESLNISDDENYNKLVKFEYVLYHELAHTSYNQMTKVKEDDGNTKEIHSDLCSIIKVIKNHDMTGPEALKLCSAIFNKRLESASQSQYFGEKPTLRDHFTETGLIHFTSSISRNMDKLKALRDNEIGDFVETFIQESVKQDMKILPPMENKPEFVKELVDKYIKENIGDNAKDLMNHHIHTEIVNTKFYEKGQFKLKEMYTPETMKMAHDKIKMNMFNNMMRDDNVLIDIYLQNRKQNIGTDKLFIEEVVKHMPAGRTLGFNAFEKFEMYKENTVLNTKQTSERELNAKIKHQ